MSKRYVFVFWGIVGSSVALFIYCLFNKEIDFITYLSGLSSFFVALLTALYVYTTSEQLNMMKRQLSQMETEQKMQQQPFPNINSLEVEVEPPRFFYTPPEKKYSFQSRYYVKGKIVNLTDEPAILVDIIAKIEIPEDGKDSYIIETVTKRIDVLSSKMQEEVEIDFMFSGDTDAKVFQALRSGKAEKYPKIDIDIFYRNLLGGYFKQKMSYYIIPDEMKRLNEWHILINSFETQYYEQLAKLRKMDVNDEKRESLFKQVKEEGQKKLGEAVLFKLPTLAISEGFSVEYLSEKQYLKFMKRKKPYSRYLGRLDSCDNDK